MSVACLDLPALPLQIVWRREPAWRAEPVVIIDVDRPQGVILWACERARAAGVLVGQRYAHALSLCSTLRARMVPPEQIAATIVELRAALHGLSPRVEPGEDPGTFWLDGDGLGTIFPDAETAPRDRWGSAWGRAIERVATALGFQGAVVVGYSRFASYAIARAMRTGVAVMRDPAHEHRVAGHVPLARLEIQPKLRDALDRLGITKIGELVRLPNGGILERFGTEAHRLYQLAAGERWDPLVPVAAPESPDERVLLDDDERDVDGLAFILKAPVERLLARLAATTRALTALHLELTLRHAVGRLELRTDCIKPSGPTLDSRVLARLVHLRLSGEPPRAPVHEVRVWSESVAATREQLALFAEQPRRDLRAADEALARIRAELGENSVVRAVVREGHLPEATYGWERLVHVVTPKPKPTGVRPLVRRILAKPRPLPPQVRQVRDDGWLLSGLAHGAVTRIVGPYVVSGGWWAQSGPTAREIHREYHYAELRRGDTLWVYYDRNRRRWFWHGSVE